MTAPDMISVNEGRDVVIVETVVLGVDAIGRALSDAPREQDDW